MDPVTFSALYMGRPTPDDGTFFKAADLIEYDHPSQLPQSLRMYGASDHAVSVKADRDYTVIGNVGVDEKDDIWVMPDLIWERIETFDTVEHLLRAFKRHKPLLWFLEDENISKSFGPFLRRRMAEEATYTAIQPMRVAVDKKTRARSIQGRAQMRKIHFPAFASWWPDAKAQMLRFPAGANDDFVDFMSLIGQGLDSLTRASPFVEKSDNVVRIGSMEWTLRKTLKRGKVEPRQNNVAGW
jgi:predicted phage terminase large subunit-like protein